MDWTTFFQDNSQSLFTLGGVFLGSFITFLISYINNQFQAKERDKDRGESRREARIQLSLELMRNDIKTIEDAMSNGLQLLTAVSVVRGRKDLGLLSEKDMRKEILSMITNENSEFSKLAESDVTAEMLIYAFGDEFYSEFSNFNTLFGEYVKFLLGLVADREEDDRLNLEVIKSAGRLHNMLANKLIALRNE